MNEFEDKLRAQTFRPPPPELREAIFGAVEKIAVPPRATWRDWFWPSPAAWGALAALWLVFAALSWSAGPEGSVARGQFASTAPSPPVASLLTYHTQPDLRHALELTN